MATKLFCPCTITRPRRHHHLVKSLDFHLLTTRKAQNEVLNIKYLHVHALINMHRQKKIYKEQQMLKREQQEIDLSDAVLCGERLHFQTLRWHYKWLPLSLTVDNDCHKLFIPDQVCSALLLSVYPSMTTLTTSESEICNQVNWGVKLKVMATISKHSLHVVTAQLFIAWDCFIGIKFNRCYKL